MVCGKNEITQSMSSTGPSPEKMFSRWYLIFFINCYLFCLLHCVFIAVWGLSLVVVSRGHSLLWYLGFSLWWYLLLPNMSSRHEDFSSFSTWAVFVMHGFSYQWHVGSFQTRDWTHVPCMERCFLYHWTTREAQNYFLMIKKWETSHKTWKFLDFHR